MAGRGGRRTDVGVFDLSFDWTDGRWQLVGCAGLRVRRHESPPPARHHPLLPRAGRESLREAITARDVPTRYACAHVAALGPRPPCWRPGPARRRGARRQKNAWVLLAEVAPELAEWATFFAAGAAKRAAAEAGSTRAVSEREADDLVRDADRFLAVESSRLLRSGSRTASVA